MRISDWSSDVCSSDLTPISKTDTKLARANGTNGILWHPSIHLTTDQVFHYHHEHALTLHEAYEVYGATRLSCAFCVLARKHDIAVSAGVTANTALYRLPVEIEARTGSSFPQTACSPQYPTHPPLPPL